MTVTIRRVGGMEATLTRVGEASVAVTRVGEASVSLTRIGGMNAPLTRVGGMTCRFGLVCGTNIDQRPGILWASDGRLITLEGGFLIPNGR